MGEITIYSRGCAQNEPLYCRYLYRLVNVGWTLFVV